MSAAEVKAVTKLDDFIAANILSPVVSGAAIGNGGEGGYYTMQSGNTYKLSAKDLRSYQPRWLGIPADDVPID